jgi:peptidoglycan/LPS O-acetylase OafA/YrhL
MAFSLKLHAASDKLLNLDFLRLVASSGVIVYHSIEYFVPKDQREGLIGHLKDMTLFVDLFFVISGFVIAYMHHARVSTFAGYGNFIQRRIGRLVPLHLLTLLISILIMGSAASLGQPANHMPSFETRCIAQTAIFLHAIVKCGNGYPFNGVSWSIGAEMAMYLLFPVFALVGQRTKIGILVATAASLLAAVTVYRIDGGAWEELWPPLRALPSFLVGVSSFYWRDALRRVPKPGLIMVVSLTGMLIAMPTAVPELGCLALAYVVVVSAIAADVQGSVASSIKWFGPHGQLTYSLYMWHSIPITVFLTAIGDKLLHAGTGLMLVIGAACYASIFIVSYISFIYIETPARRWIDSLELFPSTRPRKDASVPPFSHRLPGEKGEALTS